MLNFAPIKTWLASKSVLVAIAVITLVSGIYFLNTKSAKRKHGQIDAAYASYISAHTAGSISRASSIRVQLANNFADSSKIGEELHVFSFEPNIKGTTRWLDASTIEFIPAEPMPSGQNYVASFLLDKIVDVPDELEEFEFDFKVINQDFEVSFPTFETLDPLKLQYQRIAGTLITADIEDEQKIEQLLKVSQSGKLFTIKWDHAADKKTHRYVVDSLIRKNIETEALIQWDGASLNLDKKGEHKLAIPAIGDFSAINAMVVNDGSQYISVYFSDPIMQGQDLKGLIHFDGNGNAAITNPIELKYTIDGHYVKCYPNITLSGTYKLNIELGIQNSLGYKLKSTQMFMVDFADLLPSVSFIGKGVIMPSSQKLMMPFESVGLKAVDVIITKIYENNVAQFLQINDLKSEREIARVGRPIIRKTIALDNDKLTDLRKVNTFNLNLDKFIRTEPGAIYQVKITFKKAYSLYRCTGDEAAVEEDDMKSLDQEENWDGEKQEAEASLWDYSEEYYNEDYNWNDRDDPCKKSYYNPQRWAKKNIMASDLGIIAKKGSGNQYFFAVTNLLSTKPMSGVTLDLLDYQQQIITTGTTDGDGWAKINFTRKPFLLVAKFKEQRGYLKLDDGSTLSVSQFDVSGDVVQKGLKGLLYGERGVWRPGDSLYLNFILDDKNNTLPPFHPVSLEIYNPLGALYKRIIQTQSLNGFYDFRTSTDADAITGNYLAKVKVGGVIFQRTLKIETVMPNRLKIELNFPKATILKDESLNTILKSKWLHGAIADKLDAKVEATLTPTATGFKRFADYTFDNPTKKFSSESQVVFEGKLDENGEANLKINFNLETPSAGMLNANFITKVFEPGGSFSVDRFSIPYHPYTCYVGMKMPKGDVARGMLLTDTNHVVQIVCVNPDGALIKGTRKVTARLYKINWRWWWDKSEDDLSSYANSEEYSNLFEKEITTTNGIGKFDFKVNYPEWGRYLMVLEDEAGHSTGKAFYMDWPGWAGRAQNDNSMEAVMLNFNLNKSSFSVGEKASITLPTPQAGRALLSIESGTEVIETHWIEAQKGQTTYQFTITKDMLPNVYAHVTLVQPHAQILNDLPIRLYGMMPISVVDPQSKLSPVITMPNQIRPDVNNNISISELSGKAMTYTLAIVDEGLLDLTRFKTPDPHSHFYAREALGVKTWDLYDFVMGAFGTQFNRVLSIGGDEGLNRKSKSNKAKRFKPAVKFIGPFYLAANQQHNHNINIQDYVGAVRVMVVAGYEGAYGFAEKSVPVKKPLMILATLPRVLRPNELVKLPVNVFALENSVKQVSVQVIGNNLVEVVGSNKKNMIFSKPGDEIVNFDLRVKKELGIAKVKVIASSGNEKATYEFELEVENPNPYENNIYEGSMEANAALNLAYELPGITGTNTASLEVSSIPPINLEKRLRYLIQYPHGCVEQTTSAIFPQLALNQLMDLNDGWKKQIDHNLKAGITRLKGFQTSEGGMSYWQGEQNADEWASNYAGHFMVEAQNAGYSLPLNFLNNWKKFQRNKALAWVPSGNSGSEHIQAYRLYTLALSKSPELGAMNRLKEQTKLSSAARWRLAAAYVLAGNKDVALSLIKNEKILVLNQQNSTQDDTYGSVERDEAMMLETLILLGDNNKATALLKKVCNNLGSQMYMSTQTTAYSLLAVASLTGKFNSKQVLEFEYTFGGKTNTFRTKQALAQIQLPINGNKGGKISIKNKSGQLTFVRLITRGKPELGKQTSAQQNMVMEVHYKTMQDQPLNPSSIVQGTDFKVEVSISNPGLVGDFKNLALSQIFPSGWEIHNARMNNTETDGKYGVPRYQDWRDDRVYSYFDLGSKQKVTFVVLLNAAYLGNFYLPGFSCEAMYNGNVQAREVGKWVEVIKLPKTNTD
ncbi:MAG: alpha-2-macroglobulin family protein [bacterium]|nr:alpha-2-macroglobulin family protein [bacterium]